MLFCYDLKLFKIYIFKTISVFLKYRENFTFNGSPIYLHSIYYSSALLFMFQNIKM